MVETIKFSSIDAARKVRRRRTLKPFLAEADSGNEKTLRLEPGTPESVLGELTEEAADGRKEAAEKYGQVALEDHERDAIDFTRTSVPVARSAKAIAMGKGVDDWTAYFDPELTVDEHRGVYEQAATEDRGGAAGRDLLDDREVDRLLGGAYAERQQSEVPRAKDYALGDGDRDAQEFLDDLVGDVGGLGFWDVSYARTDDGGLLGSGEDFDRLVDAHGDRSSRARAIDERRQAPVTRDPLEWRNAPDRVDFPGIDDVDPAKLHEERSARARREDEQRDAPYADTREEWAMNMDTLDWPGVDDPAADPDPAAGAFEMLDVLAGDEDDTAEAFLDDLDQQVGLDGEAIGGGQRTFAVDSSPRETEETRFLEEAASEFGVDDRSDAGRGIVREPTETELAGLDIFGGGTRKNKSLDDLI